MSKRSEKICTEFLQERVHDKKSGITEKLKKRRTCLPDEKLKRQTKLEAKMLGLFVLNKAGDLPAHFYAVDE